MAQQIDNQFQDEQIAKREIFSEKAHAAFVLKTQFSIYKNEMKKDDLDWLFYTYPKTQTIDNGNTVIFIPEF